MKSIFSENSDIFTSSNKLANYYKKAGFKRSTKAKGKDILMEAEINDLV
jgi:hypothetical protein